MVARLLVVVSGLPASGKSTLARGLARRLGLPLLDKDVILEALFDSLGCSTPEDRSRLSRASDEVLFRLASSTRDAVLVSWWHGTAAERLRHAAREVVEVWCECSIDLAAERFVRRERHPGHLDGRRTSAQHLESLHRAQRETPGPLGLGELVTVATELEVDVDEVASAVVAAASRLGVPLRSRS